MPQPMLLLVEVILVIATASIYWTTRQLVQDISRSPRQTEQGRGSKGDPTARANPSAEDVEIIRDVTDLLAELQSAASAARDDWARQNTSLREMLDRSESIVPELRSLLAQAKAMSTLPLIHPSAHERSNGNGPQPRGGAESRHRLTLAEAVAAFGKHLEAKGRGERTVTRTVSHVREFATWLGGQRSNEILLSRINAREIEAYLDYLKALDYKPTTIQRKMAALKAFTAWTNDLANRAQPLCQEDNQSSLTGSARPSLLPTYVDMLSGTERRRTVFALAEQGLDRRTIAARTGLEQEVVRVLLAKEQSSRLDIKKGGSA